jgi:hypothetical protein
MTRSDTLLPAAQARPGSGRRIAMGAPISDCPRHRTQTGIRQDALGAPPAGWRERQLVARPQERRGGGTLRRARFIELGWRSRGHVPKAEKVRKAAIGG